MADLEKTVSIIFSGVDKTTGVMTGVGRNLDQFSGQVQNAAQPLANLAGGVVKTEAALAALAAGGLAYAYAQSIKFEGAAIDLKKVLGDEVESLDAAKESAIDLSNKFGVSSVEVLQSTANFKQAGFNIDESMALAEAALKLVSASELTAAESSEILVASLKGFDAPASDANRLMDILNHTSSLYATNVSELGIGMSKLSPIAKLMGMSFEETAGVLTPIIEVFRSGDEAAIALKTGLLKLISPMKPVQDALKGLEVSQKDLNGNLRSGKDILYDVSKAFETLDENQKLAFTSQLVGKDQAGRLVKVFDNLGKTTEIVTENMKNAAGSIDNEVKLALASGEVAVKRFGEGFKNLAIGVGENFRDATTSTINGATEIENTLQKLAASGAFNELFGVFEGMSSDLGELFQNIADALPDAMEKIDWSGFTGSIENLGSSISALFKAFFDDADLTTAEGLSKAIQKIIDGGELLTNVTAGIIQVFEPFMALLGDAVDYFTEAGKGAQEFIGHLMGWGVVLTVAAAGIGIVALELKAFSAVLSILTGLNGAKTISSFGAAATGVVPALKNLSGALTMAVGSAGAGASAGFLGLAAAAGYVTGTLLNEHVPAVTTASQKVLGWIDSIVNFTGTQKSANQVIKENEAYLKAQQMAFARAADKVNEFQAIVSGADLKIEIDMDDLENDLMNQDWSDFDIAPIPVPVETDFDAIQSDWDSITDEMEKSDIKLPVDADDKSIEDTKKKIKKSFTKASMGPVEVEFDFSGGTGAGPAEGFKQAFEEMDPLPMDEVFDMSGMAELMGKLNEATDPRERRMMEDAINQQIKLQRDMMEAQIRLTNSQVAAAQRMEEAARRTEMASDFDNVIKIEAAGLVPEMEAFMYRILKLVQVRASKSGAEFLLAAAT